MANDNHSIAALGAVGGHKATERAGEAGGAAAAAGAGALHAANHVGASQPASRDQVSISQEALEDHGVPSHRPNIGQGPQPGLAGGGVVTSSGGYQAHAVQPGLQTGGVFTTRDLS
jgi:hypothetical protein